MINNIFQKFPTTSRFALAILLGVLALVLTGLIGKLVPIRFVDVALLTLVTWVLYRTDGKSLTAPGLNITARHFFFLVLGLLMGIAALAIASCLRTLYTGEQLTFNSTIHQAAIWQTLYLVLPSVIVQELVFRGYLFTKTIEVTNVVVANCIFAVLFMLIHIVDRTILQHTGQLIFLIVSIPVGHLLFATALLKSKTLYFPIGLHWGNNWAAGCLMGYGPDQNTIFHVTNQQVITGWLPFAIMLLIFNGFFLLVTFLLWKWKGFPYNKPGQPMAEPL